jgi:hypothetical protein
MIAPDPVPAGPRPAAPRREEPSRAAEPGRQAASKERDEGDFETVLAGKPEREPKLEAERGKQETKVDVEPEAAPVPTAAVPGSEMQVAVVSAMNVRSPARRRRSITSSSDVPGIGRPRPGLASRHARALLLDEQVDLCARRLPRSRLGDVR